MRTADDVARLLVGRRRQDRRELGRHRAPRPHRRDRRPVRRAGARALARRQARVAGPASRSRPASSSRPTAAAPRRPSTRSRGRARRSSAAPASCSSTPSTPTARARASTSSSSRLMREISSVPVIASGGAGRAEDFAPGDRRGRRRRARGIRLPLRPAHGGRRQGRDGRRRHRGAGGGARDASPIDERIARVTFNDDGLVAAIIQQWDTREVLMLGWMDAEALRRTLTEGRVTFWSRSRQEYWRKGDTSGNIQLVRGARLDCDGDAVLVQVEQVGPACHTGTRTCFDADDLDAGARPRGIRVIRRARCSPSSRPSPRGALGVISSTQTWLHGRARRRRGARARRCPARPPIPVLAPLSLAVLALGAALSIVGLVLRYVFGALTVAIAALLGVAHRAGRVRPSDVGRRRRPSPRRPASPARTPSRRSSRTIDADARGRSSPSSAGSCCSPPASSRSPPRTAGGGAGAATARMPRPPAATADRRRHHARTTPSTRGTTSRVARIRRPDR